MILDSMDIFREEKVDIKPKLQERESQLIRIIESIRGIKQTKEWSSLKSDIFDSLTENLERDLRNEAKKDNPDPLKLNRIAGQLKWAEKFSDLNKLEEVYRVELQGVKIKLYGKNES